MEQYFGTHWLLHALRAFAMTIPGCARLTNSPVTASGHDAQASQQFAGDDLQLTQNLSLRAKRSSRA